MKPKKAPDPRSQLAEALPGIVADLIGRTRGAATADLCALVGALHDAAKIAESLEVVYVVISMVSQAIQSVHERRAVHCP